MRELLVDLASPMIPHDLPCVMMVLYSGSSSNHFTLDGMIVSFVLELFLLEFQKIYYPFEATFLRKVNEEGCSEAAPMPVPAI